MEYADLRILEAVARQGSMNRAAAELNMVQSNVTVRIRALEAQIGLPLFERSRRGVSLTPAGHRLLPYAGRIGALLKEAGDAARDDGMPRGTLRIGTLETTAALRLPPLLTGYVQAHPEVDLTVITGTSSGLVAAVLDRSLDGAFAAGPVRHPDLVEEEIFREELVLVTAPASSEADALRGCKDLKMLVFHRGCAYRQRLEALLAQRGIQTARALEFGSLDAILGCVAAGIGVTLLPRSVAAPAERAGRVILHELTPEEAEVTTVFLRRRDVHPSSALAAFVAAARPVAPVLRLAAGGEAIVV